MDARSKTDHADFMNVELKLCFTFANVAETNCKIGHTESAKSALEKAELGYATLQRFLADPKHSRHLTEKDIRHITAELRRLRERLDALQSGVRL